MISLKVSIPRATGVTLKPEISGNLVDWFGLGDAGAPDGFAQSRVEAHTDHEVWRVTLPAIGPSGGGWFVRLRATSP